jgi:hypothetical protein
MNNTIAHMTPAIVRAFQESDDFWQSALELEFGNDAGQARYEQRGKGQPGTTLRAAADARHSAYQAWVAAAFGVGR